MTLRIGGLFSGIGGFELAWETLGGEVAWVCEIDKRAQKVLRERFPNARIYDDVEQLDPAEVEAVDVLTGGSPCQGFSVAGQRTGLLHGESRLFADYVRIMEGLAERGLRFALWENVPGVLSIKNPDGERTFPHVIGALVGAGDAVPLDPRQRWNTGEAVREGRAVAWRVVDSRYFGVAQRRRRVFAGVAFGGAAADRARGAILALSEGVRGDLEARVATGQVLAPGARRGLAPSGGGGRDGGPTGVPEHVGTLTSRMQGSSGWAPYNETAHLIADDAVVPETTGPLTTGGLASPRGTETSDSSFVVADRAVMHSTGPGWWNDEDLAATLRATSGNGDSNASTVVADARWWDGDDAAQTLTTTSNVQRQPDNGRLGALVQETSATVTAKWSTGSGGPAGSETGNLVMDEGGPTYGMYANLGNDGAMEELQPALTSSHGQPGNVAQPAVLMTVRGGVERDRYGKKAGKGALLSEEVSLTLSTANEQTLFDPAAGVSYDGWNQKLATGDHRPLRTEGDSSDFVVDPNPPEQQAIPLQDTRAVDKRQHGSGVGEAGDPSYTLDTTSRAGVAAPETYCLQGTLEGRSESSGPQGLGVKADEAYTLNTADRHAVTDRVDSLTPWPEMPETSRVYGTSGPGPALTTGHSPNIATDGDGAAVREKWGEVRLSTETSTLATGGGIPGQGYAAALQTYGVRRLTPVECERLQGFPDGWTEPSGSDSARYHALGNAVTVNVVRFFLFRIMREEIERGTHRDE